MTQTTQTAHEHSHTGLTQRKDTWWIEPALVAIGFGAFGVYATYRAFENDFYEIGPYLSPFYSPKIVLDWIPFSPAFLILWIPLLFRATCYYYRKAYYRAYFLDPPACSVGHWGGNKYCGESSFPFVLQNLHRYFFYLATIVLAFLWYDVVIAFFYEGFRITSVNLVMLANVILLSGYSFGCHAYRHLCGGALDCFSACSRSKARFKVWSFITKLNEHHMAWAWMSLFSVGFTDFYIRQIAQGSMPDIPFISIH
ncbi:MAG TPA: hypothetical protein V6D17_23155 [Candidatus Obscuribacterales bacterium]